MKDMVRSNIVPHKDSHLFNLPQVYSSSHLSFVFLDFLLELQKLKSRSSIL